MANVKYDVTIKLTLAGRMMIAPVWAAIFVATALKRIGVDITTPVKRFGYAVVDRVTANHLKVVEKAWRNS